MAKKATVKYENPVVQYRDNLMLTTIGDVWAYYKIKPFQINVANVEDKRKYKKVLMLVLLMCLNVYKNMMMSI